MSKNSGLGDAPFTGKNQVSLSPRLLILSLEWKLSEQNARLTIHQTHEEQPFFSRIYPWPTPQLHRKTLDCLQLLDGSQSHISVHVSRTSSAGLGNKDLPPRMDRDRKIKHASSLTRVLKDDPRSHSGKPGSSVSCAALLTRKRGHAILPNPCSCCSGT